MPSVDFDHRFIDRRSFMSFKRMFLGMAVLGLALTAVGCKKVQTTFVNNTGKPLELQVNGPGNGVGYLGTIPPHGEIRTLVRVSYIWLPMTYTYTASEYSDAFSIAKDTPERIEVGIPRSADQQTPAWRHAERGELTGEKTPIIYEP
jgi:hypothetical protein